MARFNRGMKNNASIERPCRMLGFVTIRFFGSSSIVMEWDKKVPEIIFTTFVFETN